MNSCYSSSEILYTSKEFKKLAVLITCRETILLYIVTIFRDSISIKHCPRSMEIFPAAKQNHWTIVRPRAKQIIFVKTAIVLQPTKGVARRWLTRFVAKLITNG